MIIKLYGILPSITRPSFEHLMNTWSSSLDPSEHLMNTYTNIASLCSSLTSFVLTSMSWNIHRMTYFDACSLLLHLWVIWFCLTHWDINKQLLTKLSHYIAHFFVMLLAIVQNSQLLISWCPEWNKIWLCAVHLKPCIFEI